MIPNNRWFISDTHFWHANIIGYCQRPFKSVLEMNERLIENWNACVAPHDMVFFIGDFGIGSAESLASICQKLHGSKICIRGNHDSSAFKMSKIGFSYTFESVFIKIGSHCVELIHVPSELMPSHFQLHGHVHEKQPNRLIGRQLNLSVEVWDYRPVSEKTILSLLDKAGEKIFADCAKFKF